MTKVKAPADAGEKKQYRVLSPLRHNGEDFEVGDTVSLADGHAAPLLDVKTIEPVAPAPEKAAPAK